VTATSTWAATGRRYAAIGGVTIATVGDQALPKPKLDLIILDCPDAQTPGRFYAEVLGWDKNAVAWADKAGVALIRLDLDGGLQQVNAVANAMTSPLPDGQPQENGWVT